MLVKGVKTLRVYLEDWQKNMIKHELEIPHVCDYYDVQIGTPAKPTTKYGVPTDEKLKRMYFTEWQIREIRDETGIVCEFIELIKSDFEPWLRYKPPASHKS